MAEERELALLCDIRFIVVCPFLWMLSLGKIFCALMTGYPHYSMLKDEAINSSLNFVDYSVAQYLEILSSYGLNPSQLFIICSQTFPLKLFL